MITIMVLLATATVIAVVLHTLPARLTITVTVHNSTSDTSNDNSHTSNENTSTMLGMVRMI